MQKYKTIIGDWEAFKEACNKPAISTVRKNEIKAGDGFKKRLRERFSDVEQSEWNQKVFRLRGEKTPGKSMLHWLGEYYVQEESAALPVEVLNPQPGDKILDMCAAPGGKTTQIASKIQNEGMIIANDDSAQRMKSLHANIYRTGSACVTATNYDGRHLPEDERFDRILLDAPCTGEGDRARRLFEEAEHSEIEGLSQLQKQLGEKAAKLLKEGGDLVYSTCTFTPKENEEIVEHLIETTELELKEIDTSIPHREGVTEFQGEEYMEQVRKTVRVYPHHLNSGGIYVAKLTK